MDPELAITDVHDEAAVAELRERIIACNIAVTDDDDGRSLSCFLRDDDGEMFYRTLGYAEIGRADDAPVGHGEVFFTRRLVP